MAAAVNSGDDSATILAGDGRADEVLIVDPGVDDADILLAGLAQPMRVVRLVYGADPLRQIAAALAGERSVKALHVLSHGMPGALLLAGERIDVAALTVRPGVLPGIAAALVPDALMVLYGCSVAAGPGGGQFLDYLESALDVTVAASVGPVGAPACGGAWHLRTRSGSSVAPAFVLAARAAYPGLLAPHH